MPSPSLGIQPGYSLTFHSLSPASSQGGFRGLSAGQRLIHTKEFQRIGGTTALDFVFSPTLGPFLTLYLSQKVEEVSSDPCLNTAPAGGEWRRYEPVSKVTTCRPFVEVGILDADIASATSDRQTPSWCSPRKTVPCSS
jgi:hypothetical protein